ncbi:MAG: hypothetical protein GWN58_58715 [Anaerolineae bacterium]|nr:hypothetical protein [Anaerolineae bacterium]
MEFLERVVNAMVNLHPWHSLMVHFPTAFATVGVLCILFALWRNSELFEKFAFFCMAVTSAGTALSGLAGLRDNAIHFDGGAPYLNIKIFLGVSLLLLGTASAVARWRRPDLLWNPSTRILYVAAYVGAFLLATVLGFVGGSIVYGF